MESEEICICVGSAMCSFPPPPKPTCSESGVLHVVDGFFPYQMLVGHRPQEPFSTGRSNNKSYSVFTLSIALGG